MGGRGYAHVCGHIEIVWLVRGEFLQEFGVAGYVE